jgi:hypothetical protein
MKFKWSKVPSFKFKLKTLINYELILSYGPRDSNSGRS